MTISTLYHKKPALEALGALLHERFNDDEVLDGGNDFSARVDDSLFDELDNQPEGIQSLERMTWLRWLWFILGALPPAIKLLAMRGVPWAQTWGMMFLFSWIINESLVLFAFFNPSFFTISRCGRVSWPGHEQLFRLPAYKRYRRKIVRMERYLLYIAIIIHLVLMNGTFRMVWRGMMEGQMIQSTTNAPPDIYQSTGSPTHLGYPSYQTPRPEYLGSYKTHRNPVPAIPTTPPSYYWSAPYSSQSLITLHDYGGTIGCLIISTGMSVAFGVMSLITGHLFYKYRYSEKLAWRYFLLGLILTSTVVSFGYSALDLLFIRPSLNIFLISTSLASSVITFLYFLSRRFFWFGKNVLLLYSKGDNGQLDIDHAACLTFVFFVATVTATSLWYGYFFDSVGTFSPKWTGVFG